jgi:hypothetical protein
MADSRTAETLRNKRDEIVCLLTTTRQGWRRLDAAIASFVTYCGLKPVHPCASGTSFSSDPASPRGRRFSTGDT